MAKYTNIVTDSRKVVPGSLFIAYKGVTTDGHAYIDQAIAKGAVAVMGEQDLKLAVPYTKVKDGRLAWAQMMAEKYDHPEKKLFKIGVTGTDGKTTTATLIYEMLSRAGIKTGLITTVAAKIGTLDFDTGFHVTTSDPDELFKFLDMMVKEGLTHVVLETTSHALDQHRTADMAFEIAVITNITHEHLDYHQNFANYRAAKAKILHGARYAVLNQDDPSFEWLSSQVKGPTKIVPFTKWPDDRRSLALAGDYNLSNIAAAVAVAKSLGVSNQELEVIKSFTGVPGRMEEIKLGQQFRVIVDFAHTPNALEQVLFTLRKQLFLPLDSARDENKLILIFGCAGLRDHTKRPLMGSAAAKYADKVIVTAEDPRTEKLEDIYQQIMSGVRSSVFGKVTREDDRQQAINTAIKMAKPGDIVVITGKGHEQSMCFGTTETPWSDKQAVEKALKMLK